MAPLSVASGRAGVASNGDEATSGGRLVELYRLAPAPYAAAWEWQRRRAAAVAAGEAPEALLLVEHAAVYTMGPRTDPDHLLRTEAELRALGAAVVQTDRGGDVTWHGPGQLVGYPILDLAYRGRDLHAFVFSVEELLIEVAARYGIEAQRTPGRPGIWVGTEKLAALGIRVARNWVSYHGFALNVDPDLRWFEHIVPCGLHGAGVTSLARLLGFAPDFDQVARRAAEAFSHCFKTSLAPAGRAGPSGTGGVAMLEPGVVEKNVDQ